MSDDSAKTGLYLRLSPSEAEERAGYRVSDINEPLWGLGPLGRVNLFVGSTSSGKSRLMRSILRQGEYEYHAEREHVRSTGMALATLNALFGNSKQPGPLRTLRLRFDQHLPNFQTNTSSSIGKSEGSTGYKDYAILTPSEAIFQQLANLGIQGNDVKQYSGFLHKEIQTVRNAIEVAANAHEINGHERNTEGFERNLKHLKPLLDTLVRLEIDAKPVFDRKVPMAPVEKVKRKRIYIPVLRNPNPLQRPDVLDGVFAETVRKHYALPDNVEVSTGQELYEEMNRTRSSEGHIRDRHWEFERFLSAAFFAGAPVDVVPIIQDANSKLRRITIRIGSVERDLPTVGDGIQSLIILMYTLFRAEPGTHIFIEEPENSLHPGLQRIVLETILTNDFLREKNLRIFMTTHSNHLVDLSIRNFEDASIFVFEKYPAAENSAPSNEIFLIRPANNARMHAIASLEALNSSVLMANCSIWVEGVTDRLYLRAYLDAYWQSNEFKEERKKADQSEGPFLEDIHYAFFEYAGSNLAHYEFDKDAEAGQRDVTDKDIRMQFIANRVFLIADRDGSEDPKKIRKHDEWKEMAKDSKDFSYYVTKGREIENMISAGLLKELLRNKFIRGVPIEKIDAIQENDYRDVGLGKYLDDHFGGLKAAIRADKGDTLASDYKLKLAEKTRDYLQEQGAKDRNAAWNLLSDEAKALAKDIDGFIRRHNPRVSV